MGEAQYADGRKLDDIFQNQPDVLNNNTETCSIISLYPTTGTPKEGPEGYLYNSKNFINFWITYLNQI